MLLWYTIFWERILDGVELSRTSIFVLHQSAYYLDCCSKLSTWNCPYIFWHVWVEARGVKSVFSCWSILNRIILGADYLPPKNRGLYGWEKFQVHVELFIIISSEKKELHMPGLLELTVREEIPDCMILLAGNSSVGESLHHSAFTVYDQAAK